MSVQQEKTWTVYMHVNKINGKKYIGITSNKNPEYRWNNGKAYRSDGSFGRAISRYGWDQFEHFIVATGLKKVEAYRHERRLIAENQTCNPNYGYNMTIGGNGSAGLTRKAMPKKIDASQPLYQVSINGVILKFFNNSNFAADYCFNNISQSEDVYGFYWNFLKSVETKSINEGYYWIRCSEWEAEHPDAKYFSADGMVS